MKRIYKVILTSIIFTILLFGFMLFSKKAVDNYNSQIQEYAPQLMVLQMEADNDEANLAEIEKVTSEIDNIAQKALFFIFVFMPIAPFLIWIFLGGAAWSFIMFNNLKKYKQFMKSFSVISVIGFVLLYIVLYTLFNLEGIANLSLVKITIGFIFLILVYYLITLAFCSLSKYTWKKSIINSFRLAKEKFVSIFFIYLGFALATIIYFLLFMFAYVQVLGSINLKEFMFINPLYFLGILIMVVAGSWLKIKIFEIIKKSI
jgi:hypothetical protein